MIMRDTIAFRDSRYYAWSCGNVGVRSADAHEECLVLIGGSHAKRVQFSEVLHSLSRDAIEVLYIPYTGEAGRSDMHNKENRHAGNVSSILNMLEGKKVHGIVPLVDSATGISDTLSLRLGLPCNDATTSWWRTDKEGMQRALRHANMSYIRSYRVKSIRQATSVWKHKFSRGSVVMKPPTSGGGDGVQVCSSICDIRRYMGRYLHALNFEKNVNDSIIMQELVHDSVNTEYIVNTVSCGPGNHFVTDIWMSRKLKLDTKYFLYDTQELVRDWSDLKDLTDYVFRVLDAVGMAHGASHLELLARRVVLPENNYLQNILLVEINPRVAGEVRTRDLPCWSRLDQIYWLVLSLVDPKLFCSNLSQNMCVNNNNSSERVIAIFLNNSKQGGMARIDPQMLLRIRTTLKSFFQFGRGLRDLNRSSDEEILRKEFISPKTVNLLTSPGVVLLVGPTAAADAATIRQWEQTCLYQLILSDHRNS